MQITIISNEEDMVEIRTGRAVGYADYKKPDDVLHIDGALIGDIPLWAVNEEFGIPMGHNEVIVAKMTVERDLSKDELPAGGELLPGVPNPPDTLQERMEEILTEMSQSELTAASSRIVEHINAYDN